MRFASSLAVTRPELVKNRRIPSNWFSQAAALMAIVALTVMDIQAQPGGGGAATGVHVERLGFMPGEAGFKVSPDGRHIASAMNGQGGAILYRDAAKAGRWPRIWADLLVFSPDSSRLAYVAESEGKPFVV
jgi:hypothetical protein